MSGVSQEVEESNPGEEPGESPVDRIVDAHIARHSERADDSALWSKHVKDIERLIKKKKYVDAERSALRALELAEFYGRDDSRLGLTLELLAQIYSIQGLYRYGAPVMMRLLQLYRRRLGVDHIDTGTVTHNAAILYHRWKKMDEASVFYQQAMFIKSSKLGFNHPDVDLIRNNYADYLRESSLLKSRQSTAYKPLPGEKLDDAQGKPKEFFTRSGQFDSLPPELFERTTSKSKKKKR